jgi:hypothetical protein
MFIIDDRYKNYGLEYTMSYTLTQYQTTPGISRDYVSTFELGSFSANRHETKFRNRHEKTFSGDQSLNLLV